MATALVFCEGSKEPIRAMCDIGAQVSVITEEEVKKRKWKTYPSTSRLLGFNDTKGVEKLRQVIINIKLKVMLNRTRVTLVVVPDMNMRMPGMRRLDIETPLGFKGELADPSFREPGAVGMILGSGPMALVQEDESILHNNFRWQKTQLGWLVYGGEDEAAEGDVFMNVIEEKETLEELLARFWEQDEVPTVRVRSKMEEECERIFREGHSRNAEGGYRVRIPVNEKINKLGSTREAALRRFHALERRFETDPDLKAKYTKEMNALLEASYMIKATRPPKGPTCYLPHHAVLAKFRVVNDASCKSDQGLSLNDCQLIGERRQDKLFTHIARFQIHRIGITGDVRKMYLMVEVVEDQWDLQRIFWREEGQPIQEYWLTRLTFGLASAPHCAVRAMQQCAMDEAHRFPLAAKVVLRDFYMDDLLTGADTDEEAIELMRQLKELLAAGGFELTKWYSNRPGIIETVDKENEHLWGAEESTVLGLRWLGDDDELSYSWRGRDEEFEPTMEGMAKDLAQIFDPMGGVGPVVVAGRLIMRQLHMKKLRWKERVSEEDRLAWERWRDGLRELRHLRAPRWKNVGALVAIHGFADASEVAYGAVVYLQLKDETGERMVFFASKARVAPTKTLTIPRLELCAALLLSKLTSSVIAAIGAEGKPVFVWSDSTITLAWLKREAGLKVFVHNRVQQIQELSQGWTWGHIKSELNPADILSRGVSPKDLQNNTLWWNGPDLQLNVDSPLELTEAEEIVVKREEKKAPQEGMFVGAIVDAQDNTLLKELNNTCSFWRLIRKMCWIKLFIRNCRRGRRQIVTLAAPERERQLRLWWFSENERWEATKAWVRVEQAMAYGKEISALHQDKPIPKSSDVLTLSPMLDEQGLLRVGGRLGNADLGYEERHPLLLPKSCRLSKILVSYAHEQLLHGGTQLMALQLRERFGITRLKDLCKETIAKCVVCIRYKAMPIEQKMGDVPSVRVTPGRAFEVTGVDYAGPFEAKPGLPRSRVRLKGYVGVFVCMKTKETHLEWISDLTSKAFVRGFKRFQAVRNPCRELWSDNASTFVGANKELRQMVKSWQDGDEDIANMGVKWNFISPRAPHQGGIWEAAVKSMKHHLRRVVGQQILNVEEWQTLLAQISQVMNSRPLVPMTDDPEDLGYLTPHHLSNGGPAAQLFGRKQDENPRGVHSRYELMETMAQGFWKRWSSGYLRTLQGRNKWQHKQPNLEVGELVIVMEDNVAPTYWKMGRVRKVMPGADGLVRNVVLKVAGKDKLATRCVQKLVRLPVN